MKIQIITCGLLLLGRFGYAQETPFQNLDFEQANPVSSHTDPTVVTAASAFPGWLVYCGSVKQTQAYQNNYALNLATGDIFGPNYPSAGPPQTGAPGIIDGSYTAVVQGGPQGLGSAIVDTSLKQTGTIPAADTSLIFKAWDNGHTGFSVSFAGNSLSLLNLGSGPNYTLWGADISPYAGQTGLLAFTATAQYAPSLWELDDITFSTQAVPEPSPLILAGFGGLMFLLRRRFAANKR